MIAWRIQGNRSTDQSHLDLLSFHRHFRGSLSECISQTRLLVKISLSYNQSTGADFFLRLQSSCRSRGPSDVDGAEVPAVRMAHVQEVTVRRFAPLEHGRLIPGRTADRQQLKVLEQAEARHLQDNRIVRKHKHYRPNKNMPDASAKISRTRSHDGVYCVSSAANSFKTEGKRARLQQLHFY